MEHGLAAGEVTVHLLGTAEVPFSKAQTPNGSPFTLASLHVSMCIGPVCICVFWACVCTLYNGGKLKFCLRDE